MKYYYDFRKERTEPSGGYALREMKWLREADTDDDAHAFFLKARQEYALQVCTALTKTQLMNTPSLPCSQHVHWLYSLWEQGLPMGNVVKVYHMLHADFCWTNVGFTFEDLKSLCSYPTPSNTGLYAAAILIATGGQYARISPSRVLYALTPTMLRRPFDREKIQMLVRDTPVDYASQFNSINALQAAHDAYLTKQRKEAIARNKTTFTYTAEFEAILDKVDGWYWPKSIGVFIERGIVHHNCVANYADRQSEPLRGTGSVTRLAMNEDTTAEFRITSIGTLLSVHIVQCKGAYNKNASTSIAHVIAGALRNLKPEDFDVIVTKDEETIREEEENARRVVEEAAEAGYNGYGEDVDR